MTIYVSAEYREFKILRTSITTIEFFRAVFEGSGPEALHGTMFLIREDVRAFTFFTMWLRRGGFPQLKMSARNQETLVRLITLAEHLGIQELAELATERLGQLMDNGWIRDTVTM